MRSLNLDQLRTLMEVVACGSFSAAARRLNLTQPAVSLQIRELEARFGVQLIERLGKRAHATAPGQQLVEAGQRIFQECDAARAAMGRFRSGWLGRVRVGTTLTALTYRLPSILSKLRADRPDIELFVSNMPTQDAVAGIIQNKIDLAIVVLPIENKELRTMKLCEEKLVAIFTRGTTGVPPDEITPGFVASQRLLVEHTRSSAYPLVMGWLSGQRSSACKEPTPIGTVEALKTAVASGLGMSIVPEIAVAKHKSDFIVRALQPPLRRTLALIEHRCKPNERAQEMVRNALLGLRPVEGNERTRRPRKR
jgi:DNA-binding transcriptional LysR family regulator